MARPTEPDKIIYSMIRVSKSHERRQVLKDITLSYFYGAKIGVLGMNGSGKSTLLRILAGLDKNFEGQTVLQPGLTIGFLEQEPLIGEARTVREVVEEGAGAMVALLKQYDEISDKLGEPMEPDEMDRLLERQGEVQEGIERGGGWELDSRLRMAMDALRCPPDDMPVGKLSGGERRRVALCRLLLSTPDILLLDEPTNHLDAESVAWLEQHLRRYEGTIIAVTHDRYFLDNVAGWILELDRGEGIPWKGNYTSWLEQKSARMAVEQKQETLRQRTLQRELDWVRQNPKGRQSKGKARVKAYDRLLDQNAGERVREMELFIPPGPRLGNLVIEAQGVSKAYDDRLLFEEMTFSLPPGGIIGVVGPNGAGKTTLFRMIVGDEMPDTGTVKVGESVQLAYVEQSRDALPDEKTVWEAITDGDEEIILGRARINSRAYVSRLGFTGQDQQKKVGDLSGGERNRVHLARILKSGANVILLDEPTNDLDVNTMRALEDALESFAGCAVVISHDRWFLDRVATHILAFEGESSVRFFPGSWSEYEANFHKRLGADADQPHRIRYRKLARP